MLLRSFLLPALKIYVKSLTTLGAVIGMITDLTGGAARNAKDDDMLQIVIAQSKEIYNCTLAVGALFSESDVYLTSM
jgi:hypothetical protein